MYKVLIVDDEIFVRMGLKMSIEWEKHGLMLIGEASNGCQALELMKVNTPDIVITDIKMPEMDGVQLIREISRGYPDVKCLVLSNYDDFDLVKEAMKNGAVDYFLKVTIETEKLLQTLASLCETMKQERNSKINVFRMQEVLNDHRIVIKKKFIEDIANQDIPLNAIKNRIESLGLKLHYSKGSILYFSVLNFESILNSRFDSDNNLFVFSIINIVEEILNYHVSGEVFEYQGDFIAIITDSTDLENSRIKFIAEHVRTAIKEYLSIDVSIVYGFHFNGLDGLRDYISRILDINILLFYEENGRVFSKGESGFSKDDLTELYKGLKKEVAVYISCYDIERVISSFKHLLQSIKDKRPEPLHAKRIIVSSVSYLFDALMQSTTKGMDKELLGVVKEIENSIRFSTVKVVCDRFIHQYVSHLKDVDHDQYRDEILKVIEYIHTNYGSKISLLDMAKYVSMNKSYFSRLFKQETGEQFQYFVIKVRMEKAKELILNTDKKISDIASDVGFSDIFYFNKVFKNYFKMTPGEYKKQKSNLHM